MAKHTELFADYLERGYGLPTIFADITGFANLFKLHYCDKEIGFETEALFAMKLEEKANIYIPIYKDKMASLATALLGFDAPAKTSYTTDDLDHTQGAQSDTISTYGTNTAGEQNTTKTDLPFDTGSVTPAEKMHADAQTNSNAQTTSNSFGQREDSDNRKISRVEGGFTPDERIRQIEFLNRKATSLMAELLGEFKPLFMGIY